MTSRMMTAGLVCASAEAGTWVVGRRSPWVLFLSARERRRGGTGLLPPSKDRPGSGPLGAEASSRASRPPRGNPGIRGGHHRAPLPGTALIALPRGAPRGLVRPWPYRGPAPRPRTASATPRTFPKSEEAGGLPSWTVFAVSRKPAISRPAAPAPVRARLGAGHPHRVSGALRRRAQRGATAPGDRRPRRRRRHPDPARFVARSRFVPLQRGHCPPSSGGQGPSRTLANPVCDGQGAVTKVEMTVTEADDARLRGQISRTGAGSTAE